MDMCVLLRVELQQKITQQHADSQKSICAQRHVHVCTRTALSVAAISVSAAIELTGLHYNAYVYVYV